MTLPSSVDAPPSDRHVVFLFTSLVTTLREPFFSLSPNKYRVRMTFSHDDFFDSYTYETSGCILLDVAACHQSIEHFAKALRRRWISLPIVGLYQPDDTRWALAAARFGCSDFFELSGEPDQLEDCIQRVLKRDRNGDDSPYNVRMRLASLSAQERRVFDLALAGLTSKAIATSMGVRYQTVDKYRRIVLRKMNVINVVQLLNMLHQSLDPVGGFHSDACGPAGG